MPKATLTRLPRLRAAFRNSAIGLRDAWRAEEAVRIEIACIAAAVIVAPVVASGAFVAAVLIASNVLILIVEVLNSAIEAAVDRIGPERHELSRIAKDLGSLAVLLACILSAILWAGALWEFAV